MALRISLSYGRNSEAGNFKLAVSSVVLALDQGSGAFFFWGIWRSRFYYGGYQAELILETQG